VVSNETSNSPPSHEMALTVIMDIVSMIKHDLIGTTSINFIEIAVDYQKLD
jgi:hypothetical protein